MVVTAAGHEQEQLQCGSWGGGARLEEWCEKGVSRQICSCLHKSYVTNIHAYMACVHRVLFEGSVGPSGWLWQ